MGDTPRRLDLHEAEEAERAIEHPGTRYRGNRKEMLPSFLCIGAVKSGTSWLYENIRRHPEVWMPPVKEIHYFDDPSRSPIAANVLKRNLRGKRARRRVGALIEYGRQRRRMGYFGWYLRFLVLPRSDEWYDSIFNPAQGQIAGDVTPGYALLHDDRLAHIHSMMPCAKIIYILRNPMERDWSQAAMQFLNRRGSELADVAPHDLEDFLNLPYTRKHSDYLDNLARWERHYPANQIFVGFFDQLAKDPRGFFRSILEFLELDSTDRCIPETVAMKRNTSQYPSVPDDVARLLAQTHGKEIDNLHARFANDYTAGWLRAAERWLPPV